MVIDFGKWVVEKTVLHILGDPIVLHLSVLSCEHEQKDIAFFDKAFVFTLTGALYVTRRCNKSAASF